MSSKLISRMKKIVGVVLSFLALTTGVIAQGESHQCGSDVIHKRMLKDTNYLKQQQLIEARVQSHIANHKNKKSTAAVYTIPVVVHVIHLGESIGVGHNISDAQVISGVQQLTDAFRNKDGLGVDVNIEFELATMDPNCSVTSGINRVDGSVVANYSTAGVKLSGTGADEEAIKNLSRWPNNSYYNIWLVSEIDNNNGGNGTQGFAYFPGAGPEVDGALILNSAWGNQGTAKSWANQGETGVHEIGHALDLYHTFEGDNGGVSCPTDGCGSGVGDCCDDTSPHIRSSSDCLTSATNSCTGLQNDDVIHNYMDYSSQDCGYLFTTDQTERMRAALETERTGLINSRAFDTPLSFVVPKANSCTPVTSQTGLDSFTAGILEVKMNEFTHASGYAKQDGGYLDVTSSCIGSIVVYDADPLELSVTVGVNTNIVKAWIDYNDDGVFDNATEKVFDESIPSKGTGSAWISIPGAAVRNTFIRMRVMNDLGSVATPCHNPTYGQAEDYALIIKSGNSAQTTAVNSVSIYPNPFNDSFTVENIQNSGANYEIYDLKGKLIQASTVPKGTSIITLNAIAGVYVISIQDGNVTQTKRIIKVD